MNRTIREMKSKYINDEVICLSEIDMWIGTDEVMNDRMYNNIMMQHNMYREINACEHFLSRKMYLEIKTGDEGRKIAELHRSDNQAWIKGDEIISIHNIQDMDAIIVDVNQGSKNDKRKPNDSCYGTASTENEGAIGGVGINVESMNWNDACSEDNIVDWEMDKDDTENDDELVSVWKMHIDKIESITSKCGLMLNQEEYNDDCDVKNEEEHEWISVVMNKSIVQTCRCRDNGISPMQRIEKLFKIKANVENLCPYRIEKNNLITTKKMLTMNDQIVPIVHVQNGERIVVVTDELFGTNAIDAPMYFTGKLVDGNGVSYVNVTKDPLRPGYKNKFISGKISNGKIYRKVSYLINRNIIDDIKYDFDIGCLVYNVSFHAKVSKRVIKTNKVQDLNTSKNESYIGKFNNMFSNKLG